MEISWGLGTKSALFVVPSFVSTWWLHITSLQIEASEALQRPSCAWICHGYIGQSLRLYTSPQANDVRDTGMLCLLQSSAVLLLPIVALLRDVNRVGHEPRTAEKADPIRIPGGRNVFALYPSCKHATYDSGVCNETIGMRRAHKPGLWGSKQPLYVPWPRSQRIPLDGIHQAQFLVGLPGKTQCVPTNRMQTVASAFIVLLGAM